MSASLLLASVLIAPTPDHGVNVRRFTDAERSFSAMAGEKGMRASFLHFFAPEGIGFNPVDHVVADVLSKQEPEKTPLDYKMFWEPRRADCSTEGDLGFTTGPCLVTDLSPAKRPPMHTAYFSIWKKMPGGDLRVVFDLGTPMARRPVYSPADPPSAPSFSGTSKKEVVKRKLDGLKLMIELFLPLRSVEESQYSERFVAYRPGSGPIFDLAALQAWQESSGFDAVKGEMRGSEFSAQADFGWSWGTYEGEQGGREVTGYWAQVWKHEAAGWRVIADVISVLPPKP